MQISPRAGQHEINEDGMAQAKVQKNIKYNIYILINIKNMK